MDPTEHGSRPDDRASQPGDGNGDPARGASSPGGVVDAIETFDPAYFGLVMSTGIVSIAFRELGVGAVASPLAIFNVACYALLVCVLGVRVGLFPKRVLADLRDRDRHWGSLTFVVGTNTVGVQLLTFFDAVGAAAVLWVSMTAVTPALLYYLFVTEFVGAGKPAVSERIDGAFLLVIVCMQSLAILGGSLSGAVDGYTTEIVLVSMSYFGAGYVLYFVVVTVVTYRLLEGAVRPEDWTGPYWITMGAAAITTLAGATLGPRLESVVAWEPYAPVILGITFLAWAIASWWIPLLLALDVWAFLTEGIEDRPPAWVLFVPWARLGFGRRLHTYAPTAWGRVFPMGMYTAATLNLAGIGTFSLLSVVPAYWGWFALVVWALTLVGAARALVRVLLGSRFVPAGPSESG
ncbi:tellurite resistance/C4-dicarboxylate transporter family protein [Halobaculum magnesiiphilum]|uniref:Tellurite resistance/C4-dicarboxylate transporter family protein n=1 Tax=Halobaculum magnesiiphilum TaxID=1017351 RepID=A0A8T8WIL1_9EURY|nr:tellurite resistance/C4-dicarboxylate transporter family protein [Halobaculum magnesiiphilum]QZP39667.1 tellurite resistance/C4-dicarboxylate transporter family protein [Halobaculum magnesiiphilum]